MNPQDTAADRATHEVSRAKLPTVLYIAGYGRSGSTVLDLILGAADQAVAVGELFMFFRQDETLGCSCGQPVGQCPFWSEVRAVYQAMLGEDGESATGQENLGLAFRAKVEGLAAPLAGLFAGKLRGEYARHERALFAAVAQVAGRGVVVDSSKTAVEVAWRPAALAVRSGLKVKMIHLVRDGRAVMWSVMRGCNRKLERGEADPSLSFPRLRSVLGWTLANLAAWLESWRIGRSNTLYVSYEDLARDPAGELARIGRFAGIDLAPVAARLACDAGVSPAGESRETVPAGHSISGNRLRHAGLTGIREDDVWRTALPLSARVLYWVLGWPVHLGFVRSRTRVASPATSPAARPASPPAAHTSTGT